MRQSVLPYLAVLLLAGPVACGALPRAGTASETRTASPTGLEPAGLPMVMEWDGVTSRILMSRIRHSDPAYTVDPATYAFTGREWNSVSTTQSLPAPATIGLGHAIVLVYDSDLNREVLAYGAAMNEPSQGTLDWDGKTWTQITTAHPLPFLSGPSAAYSPDLHAVVMIDPCSSSSAKSSGDTLLFEGNDWRSVSPAHWPACPTELAYSPLRHAIVALSSDNRTWLFDGRDWSPTTPASTGSPAGTMIPRGSGTDSYPPSAAFDVKRDTWVLFGGFERNYNLANTWTGDGNWTRRSPSNAPIGRSFAAMVWDPKLDAIVLFGGLVGQYGQNPIDLSDTWSWNGSEWHQLAGRVYHSASPSAVPTA
jgi:hypothetical protein